VKDLWTMYITALDVKIAENKKKRDKTTPEDDVGDDFDEVSEEEQSNDGDDVTSQSAVGRAYRSDIQVLKRYPLFIISPLFSYLAMVILRLPITLGNIFGQILMIPQLTMTDGSSPRKYPTLGRISLSRPRWSYDFRALHSLGFLSM
jgi:hypothetical protein